VPTYAAQGINPKHAAHAIAIAAVPPDPLARTSLRTPTVADGDEVRHRRPLWSGDDGCGGRTRPHGGGKHLAVGRDDVFPARGADLPLSLDAAARCDCRWPEPGAAGHPAWLPDCPLRAGGGGAGATSPHRAARRPCAERATPPQDASHDRGHMGPAGR